ncbi:MAG: hypothetical protein ACFFG0_01330 [Candidatus Thorarchaeota archaeon]
MEYLIKEFKKYLDLSAIENIKSDKDYKKIVGIESNLKIINENNKHVGKIILKKDAPKLFLNMIVEFNRNNIKWRSTYNEIEQGLYLVNPYWVKPYSPDPKIEVPIYVKVNGHFAKEMRKMTYEQFKSCRMKEYYYKNKVPHILVEAYRNFYRMNKPGEWAKAINSTIKNYFVSQEQLQYILATFNQEKNRIKNEWNKYLEVHLREDESAKMLNELFEKREKEENNFDKVINLRSKLE